MQTAQAQATRSASLADALARLPNDRTTRAVREEVRGVLSASPAYRALPLEKRRRLANDMVRASRFIVDAAGETKDVPLSARVVPPPGARALADDERPPPDTAGQKFDEQGGAQAAQAGIAAFGDVITKADFPGFVGGLISGVFQSIVQASIDQMEAYATLLQNVAKTADQYMQDNVTEDQARDYLVERYPNQLEANLSGDQGRVQVRRDADSASTPDFMRDLGLPFPIDDLDDDTVEEQLVPAARKRMAIDRQQLLLTLVLMGINRIVVTDGKISASVVFQLDTIDSINQHLERKSTFEYNSKYRNRGSGFLWFKPRTRFDAETKFKVETHRDDDSEAEVDIKTTMKGNVDLRFKSETFPLEKVADIIGVNQNDLEARRQRNAQQQAETAPPVQAPPLPSLPSV